MSGDTASISSKDQPGQLEKKKFESKYMKLVDMTKVGKRFSTCYDYTHYENNLARYSLTTLVNKFAIAVANSRKISDSPSTTTIEIGYNKRCTIFDDVIAIFPDGSIITGVYFKSSCMYRIEFLSDSEDKLSILNNQYEEILKQSNFYQGKCIRIARHSIDFINTPSVKMKDVILPDKIMKEFNLNVLEFLTEPKLQKITKKRGIILYGPPGTGKTTLVSGAFNYLVDKSVSCVFLTCETFSNMTVDQLFTFGVNYLAPVLLVFEDIDLIAYDRGGNNSPQVMGSLLSSLNGIETPAEPIVVIGTTNRFDVLDKAIIRPCRFDRRFHLDYPNKDELKCLYHLFSGDDAPQKLLQQDKLTGAHVREIYETSRLLAAQNEGEFKQYVDQAIDIVVENFYLSSGGVGFAKSKGDKKLIDESSKQPEAAERSEPEDTKRE